jgi:hypothetical protein
MPSSTHYLMPSSTHCLMPPSTHYLIPSSTHCLMPSSTHYLIPSSTHYLMPPRPGSAAIQGAVVLNQTFIVRASPLCGSCSAAFVPPRLVAGTSGSLAFTLRDRFGNTLDYDVSRFKVTAQRAGSMAPMTVTLLKVLSSHFCRYHHTAAGLVTLLQVSSHFCRYHHTAADIIALLS